MLLDNIPAELKQYPNWVCWNLIAGSDGKPIKLPINPHTGRGADTTDPATWGTYALAVAYAQQHKLSGIGFCFSNTPYVGIDLDATVDPAIQQLHVKIEQAMASYSELSPSGKGLHIIVRGNLPANRRDSTSRIEIYTHKHYFTVTGNVYRRTGINEPTYELHQLWESLRAPENVLPYETVNEPEVFTDAEIVYRAGNAANGDLFKRLWDGQLTDYNGDHSAADQALMNILAFYTQNQEQIIRLFRQSLLGQRKKAYRPDYIQRTVSKALDRVETSKVSINLNLTQSRAPLTASEDDIHTERTPTDWALPPGIVGRIASYIYSSAPRPVQEVALAGALGLMAGICGRGYNVMGTGLNQYILVLAETGSGKEGMNSGISRLIDEVCTSVPSALNFIGPGDIASGVALHKYLATNPCFVSVLGEFGLTMQRICAPNASEALRDLRRKFLDLFHKSGHHDKLAPLIYSEHTKHVPIVKSPAFTILAESTPGRFYGALDESMIDEGLVPRFTLLEYTGARPGLNSTHAHRPSPQLVAEVADICLLATRLAQTNDVIDVGFTEDAFALSAKFDDEATKYINASDDDLHRHLWNRAHIKAIKLAALLAVGQNVNTPVITLADLEWAIKLVRTDIKRFGLRFKRGEVGTPVNEINQLNLVVSQCVKWLKEESIDEQERLLKADGLVPLRVLQQRLFNIKAFKDDRIGATNAVKRCLDTLMQQGRLSPVPAPELRRYGSKLRGAYFWFGG
jgi:hypothetical protein